MAAGNFSQSPLECFTPPPIALDHFVPLELPDRGHHRRQAGRFRSMGGGDQKQFVIAFTANPAKFHNVCAASQRAGRKTVGNPFAPRREIGLDAEIVLRPFQTPFEPADHLVQDEHDAPLFAQRRHLAQKIFLRRIELHRLHDEARDVVVIVDQQGLHRLIVVVAECRGH